MQRVFSFMGQLGPGGKSHPLLSRFKLLRLSGLLSHRVRNKTGLSLLLREFFPKVKLRIREFIPHRVKLEEVPKLGSPHGEKAYRLSRYSVLGRSMIDCLGRISLEVGPIEFDEYLAFTPESPQALLLKSLLNLYLPDGLEYDVKFIIRSKSIGLVPWNDHRLKLGLSIWVGKPRAEFVGVSYTYERFVGAIY
jgi:type VI secretion system protein ImpH